MSSTGQMKHVDFEIVDVQDANKKQYCICLEDWSDEMKESGDHKLCWYEKMKDRGLGAKLVKDTDGSLCGLIQYVPGEYSSITGSNFYFIYCIWVHGYKKGPGNRQGRGMGTALLDAAENDIRKLGASGIAAWGISLPFWMKASWYQKHGYTVVQKTGLQRLLWKPLVPDAQIPKWFEKKRPGSLADEHKVLVTSVRSGICPVMNIAYERTKKVVAGFGPEVVFSEIVADEPDIIKEWGVTDVLYINDVEIALGPPLPGKKIEKLIKKQLKKVKA